MRSNIDNEQRDAKGVLGTKVIKDEVKWGSLYVMGDRHI